MAKLIFVDEDHNLNAVTNVADAIGARDAVVLRQLEAAVADAALLAGNGIDITSHAAANTISVERGKGLQFTGTALEVAIDSGGGLTQMSGADADRLAIKLASIPGLGVNSNGVYVLRSTDSHLGLDAAGLSVDVDSLTGDPNFIGDIGDIVLGGGGGTGSGITDDPVFIQDVKDIVAGTVKVAGTAPVTAATDGVGGFTVGLSMGNGLQNLSGVLEAGIDSAGGLTKTAGGTGDRLGVKLPSAGGLGTDSSGVRVVPAPGGHVKVTTPGVGVDVVSLTGDPVFIAGVEGITADAVTVTGAAPIVVVNDGANGFTVDLVTGEGVTTTGGVLRADVADGGGLTRTAAAGTSLAIDVVPGGGLRTDASGASVNWDVVPAPQVQTSAANKWYVDQVATGIVPIAAVQVASMVGVLIGAAPPASIDGIPLVEGSRVLLKNQSVGSENGVWTIAGGAWVRADDVDGSGELRVGSTVFVESGVVNEASSWSVSDVVSVPPGPWVPGASGTVWVKASQIADYIEGGGINIDGKVVSVDAGDGLVVVDGQLRVRAGDNSLVVSSLGVTVSSAPFGGLADTEQGPIVKLSPDSGLEVDGEGVLRVTGTTSGTPGDPTDPEVRQARVVSGTVVSTREGDESLSFFHGLGTKDVAVAVSVGGCTVVTDVCRPNMNTITIGLGKAPAGTMFGIVVTG